MKITFFALLLLTWIFASKKIDDIPSSLTPNIANFLLMSIISPKNRTNVYIFHISVSYMSLEPICDITMSGLSSGNVNWIKGLDVEPLLH